MACSDVVPKADKASATANENVTPAGTEAQQFDAISALYKDGIDDANRGDKTGMVRVHGTINQPSGGEVTLYESEGRNTIEVAKIRLSNRALVDFVPFGHFFVRFFNIVRVCENCGRDTGFIDDWLTK